MTAVKSADRITLAGMREIIEKSLEGIDLTHDTEWVTPPSCPCHQQPGRSCLLHPDEGCQGYLLEVSTPAEHVVTAAILCSALPEPDSGGTVDKQEAALSLMQVIGERLSYPYTLRLHKLRGRLIEESERYEGPAEGSSSQEDAGQQSWMPRCAWCGEPCHDRQARYCRPAHRNAAWKQRRRQRAREQQ